MLNTLNKTHPLLNDVPLEVKNMIDGVYINGQWQRGHRSTLLINPATEKALASVGMGDALDVAQAVKSAQAAWPAWRTLSGTARADYLRRIAQAVEAHSTRLIQLQVLGNGKPRFEAEIDVADVVSTFNYYAELAEGLDHAPAHIALPDPAFSARVRYEPCGVVGLIVPWNFPMVTSAWKLAPALAAGCTVVLKPSEVTPLAELALVQIIADCALPTGVLNVVCGSGADVGAPMVAHPDIAKISFTGSNAVGVQVMQRAAATIKSVSLELGGKSSIVILDDADITMAVDLACAGGFFNAGQMCSATSRVLVAQAIAKPFMQALQARAEAIVVGDPCEEQVEMGALVNHSQYQRVCEHIAHGLAAGAKLITGGARPHHLAKGYFLSPTIFSDVPLDSDLWRKEIFGPVLCVRTFVSEEEAIRLANDTEFGLVATVVSANSTRAQQVADQLQAGMVWINAPQVIFPQTAWGGYKQSSIGRELGPWGLRSFQEIKHVVAGNL